MTIGERILELIAIRGMTRKEFSERTGIAQSTVSDWRGKKLNPGSDKIALIADVLQVDPAFLLTGMYKEKGNSKITDVIPGCDVTVFAGTDEYEILLEYRDLNNDNKKRVSGYMQALKDVQNDG